MKLLSLLSFLIVSGFTFAQNYDVNWLKSIEGPASSNYGYAICSHGANEIYATGIFGGTVDFDPGPGISNLTASVGIYVVKLDNAGNLVWAKCFTGTSVFNTGKSIKADASGNIYITGEFREKVDFDPGPGSFILDTGGDVPHVFVAKLDAAGNLLWVKHIGNGKDIGSNSIALDASGNAWFTGFFWAELDFDPGPANYDLTSAKYGSIYVAKFNSNGTFGWAGQFGGTAGSYGWCIDVDNNGNVYTSGPFCGTIDFDPGPLFHNLVHFTGCVVPSTFISKLDASGNFVWARQIVNGGNASLALDHSGNVYLGGAFQGTIDLDPGTGTHVLTSSPPTKLGAYVGKYDASGQLVWARNLGSAPSATAGSTCSSLAVDSKNNVHFTGVFQGSPDFDPGVGTFTTAEVKGGFISGLDASGNFLYAKVASGFWANGYSGPNITTDVADNIYCAGYFTGYCDISPDPVLHSVNSPNKNSSYVLRLGSGIISGVEDLSRDERLTIAPNPTEGPLTIYFPVSCEQASILNMNGEILLERKELAAGSQVFDLSFLPEGIYVLQVKMQGSLQSYIFVKLSR